MRFEDTLWGLKIAGIVLLALAIIIGLAGVFGTTAAAAMMIVCAVLSPIVLGFILDYCAYRDVKRAATTIRNGSGPMVPPDANDHVWAFTNRALPRMTRCKNAYRYKGVKSPRCNGGLGCDTCNKKWAARWCSALKKDDGSR